MTSFLTAARRGKGLVGAATAAFATLAMVTFSPPAQASTPASSSQTPTLASSTTFKVPGGNKAHKVTVGSAQVQVTAAVATICQLYVYKPMRYYGGTNGGGVQGLASISCPQVVTQLDIAIGLFRNGTQVTYNSRTNYSNNFINITTEYYPYPFYAANFYTAALGTEYVGGTYADHLQKDSATVYLR